MIHFLLHWLGLDNPSGAQYLWWSGSGADLTELAILGGVINFLHHHNCAVKVCPRLGKHPVKGTPYKTCHRHATLNVHKALHKQHGWEHPQQHALLNQDK